MLTTEAHYRKLIDKFPQLADLGRVAARRRIFVTTHLDCFMEIVQFIYEEMGFHHLVTITGLDEGEYLAPLYHFGRQDQDGTLINLKVLLPRDNHQLPTLISYYPVSEYYERELHDLFGIHVVGLPGGSRYPLPDHWPVGHFPLRKDWNTSKLADEKPSSEGDNHEG